MCMICRSLFVLLAILLTVLRFTDSDYTFGIFGIFGTFGIFGIFGTFGIFGIFGIFKLFLFNAKWAIVQQYNGENI